MPNFIRGVPAQGSSLTSSDVRNNFNALDDRTGILTPKATVPASTTIQLGKGKVYIGNNLFFQLKNGAVLDLGDPETGILPFLSTNQGYFKDVAITLKVTNEQVSDVDGYGYDYVNEDRPVTELVGTINFCEGPEKSSNVLDPDLITVPGDEIPICFILVRNDGGLERGDIEPIEQTNILDARPYISQGSGRAFTAIVGDKEVTRADGYGDIKVTGYTSGDFIGKRIIDVNILDHTQVAAAEYSDPIQRAIDSLGIQGGTVFIRRGVYIPERTIFVPSNIELVGEGSGTIILRNGTVDGYGDGYGDGYSYPPNGNFLGPLFLFDGAENSTIRNIKIAGAGVSTATDDPLIQFQNCLHCTISNCHIQDNSGVGPFGAAGINLIQNSRYNMIKDNYLINNRIGIYLQGSGRNLIHGNVIGATGSNIIEVEPDLYNSIRHNVSIDSDNTIDGDGNLGDFS